MAENRNVSWYSSRLNGKKYTWPVEVLRRGDGVTYVRGLAGRFRGQEFGVVNHEITSYIPPGYQLAPGARPFLPASHGDRQRLRRLSARITDVFNREEQSAGREDIRRLTKEGVGLLRIVEREAARARQANPDDRAWEYYEDNIARARQNLKDAAQYGTGSDLRHAMLPLRGAVQMIEGATERTSRDRGSRSTRRPRSVSGRGRR